MVEPFIRGQFMLNPVMRNILGQVKCKVSFPFIMDNQRLFIANLSKGKIGHDKANLLGSLLTTQFQLTETPQPTNGTSSDLRWCDWVAISLSNDKKIPFFNPFAPVLKRDATIENAKKLLGQQ